MIQWFLETMESLHDVIPYYITNDLNHFIENEIDPEIISDGDIDIIVFYMCAKIGLLNKIKCICLII